MPEGKEFQRFRAQLKDAHEETNAEALNVLRRTEHGCSLSGQRQEHLD